jgi:hypothetical protein
MRLADRDQTVAGDARVGMADAGVRRRLGGVTATGAVLPSSIRYRR